MLFYLYLKVKRFEGLKPTPRVIMQPRSRWPLKGVEFPPLS
jgi:hypothetical protein